MVDRARESQSLLHEAGLRAAGPLARGLALALDELLRWTLVGVTSIELVTAGTSILPALALALCAVYVAYGALFETFGGGATPGKRVLGLRVVRVTGEPVTLGQASIRNALLLIDMLPFGYALGVGAVMSTDRFRRVGDLAANTLVVYRARTRQPWEAADDGCVLVRRRAATLYFGWFATALAVFAACVLWLRSSPGVAGLVLWWLKPLYERMPLWLANEYLLEREPSLRDAVAHWREFVRGLVPYLTYRRLSPTRSFDVPVVVLEGLRGAPRRARVWRLNRRGHAQAMWLTIVGAHVEAFLSTAAVLICVPLIVGTPAFDWQRLVLAATDGRLDWLSNALYLLAIGAVGPVYAVAGLTLYRERAAELRSDDRRALAPQ